MAWEGETAWCGLCPSHSPLPDPPLGSMSGSLKTFQGCGLSEKHFQMPASPTGYKSPEAWVEPVKCEILVTRKIAGVCPVEQLQGKEVKMGQSGHPE